MNTATPPTVEIPAHVRGNSPYTVRVTSRDMRDGPGGAAAAQLLSTRMNLALFGYTEHSMNTTDNDGTPVTLTWFINSEGAAVWLYHTTHHTRVKCEQCEHYWATIFQTITTDEGHAAGPVARCDRHADEFRRALIGATHVTLSESERMNPGNH